MKEKVKAARKSQLKVKVNQLESNHNWSHIQIMHYGHFMNKEIKTWQREAHKSQQNDLHQKSTQTISKIIK